MFTIVLRFTLAFIVLVASPLDLFAGGPRATAAGQPVASAAPTGTISTQPKLVEQAPAASPITLCADVVPPTGIDMVDIMSVASRWGQHSGDPGWDARFDLDADNAMTVNDITLVASAWQGTCLPPDPGTVAPPLDPSIVNDFGGSISFLYTGSNPIQTGVVSGTIETDRVAVLRGKVLDQTGAPLSGVAITLLDHPELGQTLSREDGLFDMAVNGGGLLTVDYTKDGYLPAQRRVAAPWQDFIVLEDVVLTALDPAVSTITLPGATTIQVARGSVISDTDGLRQATLMVPPGTEATMLLPGGITQTLSTLHVRATEYTVGDTGPLAMPAVLPANSGYTYAVELSVDEALAAGATRVDFSQPVIQYLENFLNFATGTLIPAGYYDRERGVWIPGENGRVVKILSISNGVANLDTDGDGQPDPGNVLGITPDERQKLALLYTAGQDLWRVPIPHFTPWDFNWMFLPDCVPAFAPCVPRLPSPDRRRTTVGDRNPCEQGGSIVGCETQTLGEETPVTGTPFRLRYSSDRVPGNNDLYTLNVPLSGSSLPSTLREIELEISGAGQSHRWTFPPAANQSHEFTWNGKDAYGRPLQGEQPFIVRVGYVYGANYVGAVDRARAFATYGDPSVLQGVEERGQLKFVYSQQWSIVLGGSVAQEPNLSLGGLGGWTLSSHHAYDPRSDVLYRGDGGRQSAFAIGPTVFAQVGSGDVGCSDGPFPAQYAWFTQPYGVAAGPDGTLYIADRSCDRISRVTPNGVFESFAYVNDPSHLVVDASGDLLVASYGSHVVQRVTPAGAATVIAGILVAGFSGDGGPATQARLNYPQGVAAGPDGSIYIADTNNHRVRRIALDGNIETIAGTSSQCPTPIDPCGDGGPALQAQLKFPNDVAVGPDGSVYIADSETNRIRKISPDGIIRTVAGTGNFGFGGDGGPATSAKLARPKGVTIDTEGNLYIADTENHRIRVVLGDGTILTMVGNGQACPVSTEPCGDEGNARQAQLNYPFDIAQSQAGGLYMADTYDYRVRRLRLPSPTLTGANLLVPSSDGGEVYAFDLLGRHLRTHDGLTGGVLLEFSYDSAGRLSSVTAAGGNVTVVERNIHGLPTAIIAPGGQRTELSVNANGYLQGITNPAGETITLTSTSGGLLTDLIDAKGNHYHFTYDTAGRLVRDDDPMGGFQTLTRSGSAANYSIVRTTALGRTTLYQVEALPNGGIRRRVTDPNGGVSTWVAGTDGSQFATYPDGTKMRIVDGPDPRWGNLAMVAQTMTSTVPSGLTEAVSLQRTAVFSDTADPFSLLWMTDTLTVNGRASITVYDGQRRTITDTSAAGRQRITVLDSLGRVVSQTLASGIAPIIVSYDALGRRSVEQQADQSLTFTYDAANRVAAITDAAGRQRQFGYDAVGRLTSITLPSGHVTSFDYDANSNQTSITLPSSASHGLAYTPLNQSAGYTPPGNPSYTIDYDLDRSVVTNTLPSGRAVVYAADSGGRATGEIYPEASISLAYAPGDPTERVSNVTRTPSAGAAQSIVTTYSARLVTGMTWTGAAQGQFNYTYNNDFDITALSLNSSPNTYSMEITRDDDGFIAQFGPFAVTRAGPGGLASRIGDATLRVDFSYDALARTQSKVATANGAPFYDVQVTYDNVGRVAQKVETVAGVPHTFVYTYDPDDQLTAVTRDNVLVEQYTYDVNGNRLSRQIGANPVESSTYDAQDRLVQRGGVVHTFDADGFLVQRGSDTFQYSAKGELVQATVGGTTVAYAYDGMGRRVSRTSGASTYQYLYGDPGNAFLVTAVRNPANQLTIYHYDEASHLFAMERAGVRYLIATDQVGTPRVVRNAAGSVVKVLEYDSFGNLVSDSNTGFEFPFAFAGGLADATTGLVRFGFRDYDPAAARWTAKDPVLFEGGQGNLYVYVGNNPISLRDPLGLWCFGGSFYATLGGGAQYCRDPEKGFSICIEAGVGVGGDVNAGEGGLPDADEIGFEFNPTCFGFGGTLGCGFKICNGTATWQCGTEGEMGPSPVQAKHNGDTGGVKFNIGAPELELGRCKVQAKAFAKKCFVKRF